MLLFNECIRLIGQAEEYTVSPVVYCKKNSLNTFEMYGDVWDIETYNRYILKTN